MFRRKSLFKILSVVLAVLLLAVFFAGCGEYKPPQNTGGDTPVIPPDDPKPPTPDDDSYTVSLVLRESVGGESVDTPLTSAQYGLITDLQAQWTEITDGRAEVYRASFDKNGEAKISGLAGDYNVTLILTDRFKQLYTYDPNPARPERKDELVATRYKKEIEVPIYRIKPLGARDKIAILQNGHTVEMDYYVLNETGAYSYTFNSKDDSQLFAYSPQESGEYSFLTLMDITADEVNPLIEMYNGIVGNFLFPTGDAADNLGGSEGNYTKNIWLKYQLPADMAHGSACLAFNLYSESEKPDAYPLTIYFIFERDGEYSRPNIESVEVPITEDFTKVPDKPGGNLEFVSESSLFGNSASSRGSHILNQKNVKYNDPAAGGDGYYYVLNSATGDFFREEDGTVSAQYRLYVAIRATNPVLRGMGENGADSSLTDGQLANSYYWVAVEDGTFKNYYNFILGSNGYARHCNGDGTYPVNAELKQFLQDFAVSQRYFNDGNGHAEGMGVDSDEVSQWLFACGVYVN